MILPRVPFVAIVVVAAFTVALDCCMRALGYRMGCGSPIPLKNLPKKTSATRYDRPVPHNSAFHDGFTSSLPSYSVSCAQVLQGLLKLDLTVEERVRVNSAWA
jgi:hypothetical protein